MGVAGVGDDVGAGDAGFVLAVDFGAGDGVAEDDEAVGMGEGEGAKEHAFDDGEDGGGGADAEGEHEDGGEGEARRFEQVANGKLQITGKGHGQTPGMRDGEMGARLVPDTRGRRGAVPWVERGWEPGSRGAVFGNETYCPDGDSSGAGRRGSAELDFDRVAILEAVVVAEFHIGGDFDDGAWVVAAALLIGVGAEDEGGAAEDGAGHQIDGDGAAVLLGLEAQRLRGQGPGVVQLDIEGAGEEAKAGFAQVVVVQLFNPERKAAHTGDDFAAQNLHGGGRVRMPEVMVTGGGSWRRGFPPMRGTEAHITGGACRRLKAAGVKVRAGGSPAGMFAIIGILVVFGAVAAGYLMEHGQLAVLVQPAELLIIGGAGAGTLLIANPLRILKKIAAGAAADLRQHEVRARLVIWRRCG